MRQFDHKHIWFLNYSQYNRALYILLSAIQDVAPMDAVVGILRGGLTLATDLAQNLSIPHYEVAAQHNVSDALYSEMVSDVEITQANIQSPELFSDILLVDDICGTGKTLLSSCQHLSKLAPQATITTATLCRNLGSMIVPDFYLWSVTDWVVFPWEPLPSNTALDLLPNPMLHTRTALVDKGRKED
jgi:uncharacterized protein